VSNRELPESTTQSEGINHIGLEPSFATIRLAFRALMSIPHHNMVSGQTCVAYGMKAWNRVINPSSTGRNHKLLFVFTNARPILQITRLVSRRVGRQMLSQRRSLTTTTKAGCGRSSLNCEWFGNHHSRAAATFSLLVLRSQYNSQSDGESI
jgi:hypothetical protein